MKSLAGNMGRSESRNNHQSQSSALILRPTVLTNPSNDFDFACCLSFLNSLSNLFSQHKISLCRRNTHDVTSLVALAKTVAASQHKRRRKKYFVKFLRPTRT